MTKKPDSFTTFIVLALLFFMTPVSALLSAKLYSILWGILLEPQFGTGPTYQSWYGISLFIALALRHLKRDDDKKDKSVVLVAVESVISGYASILLTIVIALFVRTVVGWP